MMDKAVKKEHNKMGKLTHGMFGTKTYRAWDSMMQRCFNPRNKRYESYAGKGIKVCEKWLKFEGFYEDMGDRPEGLTLDRKNNDGNYCKDNCHWTDSKQQANNRRSNIVIYFNGMEKTLSQWCELFNLNYHQIYFQFKRGKPIEILLGGNFNEKYFK